MAIIFGSARIDENGKISGGTAGDQTGNEVSTQSYYTHSKGWYGYRAKDIKIAELLAQAMKEACDNNHIGYDQNQRGTLMTQFETTKSIKDVTTNCECDCSSLVRVCIYQAANKKLSDFNTESEPSVLANSGLFDKVTVNSSTDVYNGDILVTKTKGHTGIIVSGRARTNTSTSTNTTSSTNTNADTKLDVDGEIGSKTIKALQKKLGTTQDGTIDGQSSSCKKYWTSILSSVCKWNGGKSEVVTALQKKVGVTADGLLGKNTATATQKYLINAGYSCGSSGADGYFGINSAKAMQGWLNG